MSPARARLLVYLDAMLEMCGHQTDLAASAEAMVRERLAMLEWPPEEWETLRRARGTRPRFFTPANIQLYIDGRLVVPLTDADWI